MLIKGENNITFPISTKDLRKERKKQKPKRVSCEMYVPDLQKIQITFQENISTQQTLQT